MNAKLQEASDKLYADGCRDGRVESILAILDLVSDSDFDYVESEVTKFFQKFKARRQDRLWKARGW